MLEMSTAARAGERSLLAEADDESEGYWYLEAEGTRYRHARRYGET